MCFSENLIMKHNDRSVFHWLCIGCFAFWPFVLQAKEIEITFDAGKYQEAEDWYSFILALGTELNVCTEGQPTSADIYLTVQNGGLLAFPPQNIVQEVMERRNNIFSQVKKLKVLNTKCFHTDALRYVFTKTQTLDLPDVSRFCEAARLGTSAKNACLESVSAPKVTRCEAYSFSGFSALKYFNDSERNPKLQNEVMSFVAFVPEEDFFSKNEVTKSTLPNPQANDIMIGTNAFAGCENLQLVIAKCNYLGHRAFSDCTRLKATYLSVKSNTRLGVCIFSDCWNLKECLLMSETFPDDRNEDGSPMFKNCFLLETLGAPNLGFELDAVCYDGPFENCISLTNLDFRSQEFTYDLAQCLNYFYDDCIREQKNNPVFKLLLPQIQAKIEEIEARKSKRRILRLKTHAAKWWGTRWEVNCLFNYVLYDSDDSLYPHFSPNARVLKGRPIFDESKEELPYPKNIGVPAFLRFNDIYKKCFRNPNFGENKIIEEGTSVQKEERENNKKWFVCKEGNLSSEEEEIVPFEKEEEKEPKNEIIGKKVKRTNFLLHGG